MRMSARWRWVVAVAVVSLALSACEAPKPDVTFYGNRTAIETGPTRWCDVDQAAQTVNCTEADAGDVPHLSMGAGRGVQINIPGEVGETPWAVYFRYLDADGELQDARSEIIRDGRLSYTLEPLDEADQLVYVEVRSGFVLTAGAQTGVDFAATQSWLLLIDPPARAPAGAP
jgi:Protein of unknown function (DUF2771)